MSNEELTLLKERAAMLGITHSPNIGVETLKAKIAAKLNDEPDPTAGQENGEGSEGEGGSQFDPTHVMSDAEMAAAIAADKNLPVGTHAGFKVAPAMTRLELQQQEREKQWAEQLRLVRVRITNHNPAKKDLHGEIFTVANDYVGTVKKFIPYGEFTEQGYHIPFIIFNELKSRQFNSIKKRKLPNGQEEILQRLVPEFAIEELPQLSVTELEDLGRMQAAAAGMPQ